MINRLTDFLRDPRLVGVDVDGAERVKAHDAIISQKQMIRDVFYELHTQQLNLAKRFGDVSGLRIELGAGVFPIRNSSADVIATDIVPAPHLDRVLDAQKMDLPDKSVAVFFLQNTFHHFPDPEQFFREVDRTLADGGGVVMLEPYHGALGSFLFKRMFKTEGFDKEFPSWQTPMTGPMNGANQALSYIVFKRDRARFEEMFPSLKIVAEEISTNYPRYLLSGGLNFRQLLPDFSIPLLRGVETVLAPLRSVLGLHHIVVLQKTKP